MADVYITTAAAGEIPWISLTKADGVTYTDPSAPAANLARLWITSAGILKAIDAGTTYTYVEKDATQTLTNKTLTTPTIASFVNATHNHQNAAGGGSLDAAAIGSGTLNNARVNWASPSAIGTGTPAAITGTTITATTGFVGPFHRPSADAVAGVQVTNAAGSTVYTNWDTTNGFIGLGSGMTAPQAGLHLGPNGALSQLEGDMVTPWISIGSYTNFILQANTFTNASWTKTGVTAAATATSPNNTANDASNITNGGASTDGLSQAITNSTTGFWTFSVWLRAQAGTQNVDINITTDGETPTAKTVALTTTWKRYFVTQNLTVAHTTKTVKITNGTNGAISCWRANLDNSPYMRGLVNTAGAAVTTVANTIQVFAPINFIGAATITCSANATWSGTSTFTALVSFPAATTSIPSYRVPTGTAPSSPTEGDHWNDSTQKAIINYVSAIKQAVVGCTFTQTATVDVNTTASETTVTGSGIGTLTLPANFVAVGKTIRVRAWGIYSNTGTPTLQIKIKLGTVVVLDTTAKTTASGVTNVGWYVEGDVTVRATGASGNVFAQGIFQHNGGTVWTMTNTAVSGAIDFTATKAVDVTVQWGASSASNTFKCTNLSVEILQ